MVFEVGTCVATSSAPCSTDPAADLTFLNKLEMVMMYNTERFNIANDSEDPIIRDSDIKIFNFDPTKKYQLKNTITRGEIIDEQGMFTEVLSDFYSFKAGELVESIGTQDAYITGEVNLSLDRTLVTRKMYTGMDVASAIGGLCLFLYVLIWAILSIYVALE